jgi:endonuclease/exonuclease/phosphatase family metal-dependent hydrolase
VTLRLLSYNIRYGGTGREEALAAVVRAAAPDVVVLQEATRPEVVKTLADRTGMTCWGSSPGHSVGFMSRLETRHEWRKPRGCSRALLELDLAGTGLKVFGIHLRAIHSNWSERRRMRELTAILADIERHRGGFHVLTGDFNTLAPGEKLDLARLPRRLRVLSWLLGGRVRWQTIQIMLDEGYADGFRHLHSKDEGHTFPTWDPHLRLDFLFLPSESAKRIVHCEVLNGAGAAGASDHFPLMSVLEV